MTPEQVIARLDAIRAAAGDDEIAHDAEDELHRDVLSAIALGTTDAPARIASLALQTQDIDFRRWYA